MPEVRLMNMCMIIDEVRNQVVVQDKINSKNWKGITFPGGHVEDGESIIEATIREVKEETGLDVKDLKFSGLIHWYNDVTKERWLIFLYKTKTYTGEMLDETHEGKVFWTDLNGLTSMELASGMKDYLKLYSNDDMNEEAFAVWNNQFTSGFKFF